MLPGFRFLFAAIVLSMSVLVFGLGAATLLRTAHEEFASLPSRRAPPEQVFAKQNDTPVPTLALLRLDPPVAEKVPDDVPAVAVTEAVAPPEQTTLPEQTTDVAPGEPEQLAALKSEDPLPAEPVQQNTPITEPATAASPTDTATAAPATPAAATASAESEALVSADEVVVAAISETPPLPAVIASTAVEPTVEAPSLEPGIAPTKIATLGGPAVTIEETGSAKTTNAKPDQDAIRKRAQRARERRRMARRERLAREATAAAAAIRLANPFAQLTVARPR